MENLPTISPANSKKNIPLLLVSFLLLIALPMFIFSLRNNQILNIRALTNATAVEAELAALSGGTTTGNDTNASGGRYAAFIPTEQTPSSTPNPTQPPSGSGIQFISSSISRSTKGVTSLSFSPPTGMQAGDVMVAMLQSDYGMIGTTGTNIPAGWIPISSAIQEYDLTAQAFYKVATNNEPSNYTWNLVGFDFRAIAGGSIALFRGVNTTSPIFASAVNPETGGFFNVSCPSVNAPAGGMLICQFTHDDPPQSITPPPGMTLVPNSNFLIPVGPPGFDDAHAATYIRIGTAGLTGVRTATLSADQNKDGNDISIAIVLRP